MSRKDKDKLMILGVAIAIVLISVAFYFGTLAIPATAIAGVTLAIQCFIVVPKVNKNYYELNDLEPSATRFIPLWNELQMMRTSFSIATLIGLGISVVVALISRIPLEVIGRVFDVTTMIGWGYNWVVGAILCLVLTNFILGAGLVGVLRSVNRIIAEELNVNFAVTEVAFYFLAFIPLLRVCFFVTLDQKLDTLIKAGFLDREEQEFVNEEV